MIASIPAGFEPWLENFCFLMGGLFFAYKFLTAIFDRFIAKEEKVQEVRGSVTVDEMEELVTKPEVARLESELMSVKGVVERNRAHHDTQIINLKDHMHQEMQDLERRLGDAGQQRAEKIHGRIDQVLAAVSEVRGQLKR